MALFYVSSVLESPWKHVIVLERSLYSSATRQRNSGKTLFQQQLKTAISQCGTGYICVWWL